jgi:hypothetical protein
VSAGPYRRGCIRKGETGSMTAYADPLRGNGCGVPDDLLKAALIFMNGRRRWRLT